VARKVSNALTVQYDRVMYLLQDTEANRRLMHEYVEVVEYPNGAIEIQAAARVLPCREYDRITQIDPGAEVENKRLSTALEVARLVQAQRDDRRISGSPSRTHCGEQVRAKQALLGLKKQRAIDVADINHAVLEVSAKAMRERGGGCAAPTQKQKEEHGKTRHFHLAQTPTFELGGDIVCRTTNYIIFDGKFSFHLAYRRLDRKAIPSTISESPDRDRSPR
jgi:hypothetical protein